MLAESKIVLKELVTNPVSFKKLDYHKYFYTLKIKNPEGYKGLLFDTNGSEPLSKDLGDMFFMFIVCGFMDFGHNIISKSVDRINEYINSE